MLRLHLPAFIISLAIRIFVAYITIEKKRIIIVYPTPENYKKIQYKDKNDTCLDIQNEEVTCSSNIKSHPMYI